jgi:hypothetical protein
MADIFSASWRPECDRLRKPAQSEFVVLIQFWKCLISFLQLISDSLSYLALIIPVRPECECFFVLIVFSPGEGREVWTVGLQFKSKCEMRNTQPLLIFALLG